VNIQFELPDHSDHDLVSLREDIILAALAGFFDTYLFGPDRARHLAETLPATAADHAEAQARQATWLRARLDRIDSAERGLISELEAPPIPETQPPRPTAPGSANATPNCAWRIVDPDQLAGRGLDAGKTKLERLGIEPENLRRRERDMRRPARLGHGDLDHGRDLIGQIVYCRRRHQADNGPRRAARNREEVGVGGQRCLRLAEDPAGQFDDRAGVPRGVEIAGMDSVRYRLTGREGRREAGETRHG
jgi:hypothetical protein